MHEDAGYSAGWDDVAEGIGMPTGSALSFLAQYSTHGAVEALRGALRNAGRLEVAGRRMGCLRVPPDSQPGIRLMVQWKVCEVALRTGGAFALRGVLSYLSTFSSVFVASDLEDRALPGSGPQSLELASRINVAFASEDHS